MRLHVGLLLIASLVAVSATWHPSPEALNQFLGSTAWQKKSGAQQFVSFRDLAIPTLERFIKEHLGSSSADVKTPNANEYPYFRWLPQYHASVIPGGPAVHWTAPCFGTSQAQAFQNANGTVTLEIKVGNASSLLCSDFYLFGTVSGLQLQTFVFSGTYRYLWTLPAGARASEAWDLRTKGIRIFRFLDNAEQTFNHVLSTLALLAPLTTREVPDWAAKINIDFMEKYSGFKMPERAVNHVDIDESLIHSGDMFAIMRLDGLDPILAWAMGSTTGHVTVALRINGELFVVESTNRNSYWPTNGVQATPYKKWIEQVRLADMQVYCFLFTLPVLSVVLQVVWTPLSPAMRAKFNETAAANFFRTVEGLDYGYSTILWGWLDTLTDNYPCLPPDFKTCMQWEHIEILFATWDRLAPELADQFFKQAFNHRLGTNLDNIPDLFHESYKKGLDARKMPTIPERDEWLYRTTRYENSTVIGKSMVCCVAVCNIWKAAGVFADIKNEINCGELTNWDDYALAIFDDNYSNRPKQCRDADPENPVCQISGKYKLYLNNYNSKKMYPHMAESCPSKPPKYVKPEYC